MATKSYRTAATIILGAGVVLAGAATLERRPRAEASAAFPEIPECPHEGILDERWLKRELALRRRGLLEKRTHSNQIASDLSLFEAHLRADPEFLLHTATVTTGSDDDLSGDILGIPEFHDCQRFIVEDQNNPGGPLVYDSQFSIFAREFLDTVFPIARIKHREVPKDSINLAGVSEQVFTQTEAMATIVSFGGTYKPLGLAPGVNCLYLEHTDATWRAYTQPNGPDRECPMQRNLAATSLELAVYENQLGHPLLTPDDVPPVARWDWSDADKLQYIGIRCGTRWCEIGPKEGFARSAVLPVPPEFDPPERGTFADHARRVFLIKGWYDRQLLAIRTNQPHGGAKIPAVPSRMMGVVVPYPTLDGYHDPQFGEGWLKVAYVYVDQDLYNTPKKHNLFKSLPGQKPNLLESRGPSATKTPGTWKARYNGKHLFTITFRPHPWAVHDLYHIPGTARWRWQADDETTWTRCPNGCCESN